MLTSALPSAACHWRHGNLINGIPTGATDDLDHCRFVVRDPEFLHLLGLSPKMVELAKTDAHEGAARYPDRNELLVPTTDGPEWRREDRSQEGEPGDGSCADHADIRCTERHGPRQRRQSAGVPARVGEARGFHPEDRPDNGEDDRGFLQLVRIAVQQSERRSRETRRHDLVHRPQLRQRAGLPKRAQGEQPGLQNQRLGRGGRGGRRVSRSPTGWHSHTTRRVSVTDTGFGIGKQGRFDITRPHSVTVFDVGGDGFLCNRRLFASVGVYDGSGPGLGVPDGIKVDIKERVYVATVDGVQVFAHSGKPLGLIRQPGVTNMGFAGEVLDTMYMLNDTTISYVKLKVKAAGLKYASAWSRL